MRSTRQVLVEGRPWTEPVVRVPGDHLPPGQWLGGDENSEATRDGVVDAAGEEVWFGDHGGSDGLGRSPVVSSVPGI